MEADRETMKKNKIQFRKLCYFGILILILLITKSFIAYCDDLSALEFITKGYSRAEKEEYYRMCGYANATAAFRSTLQNTKPVKLRKKYKEIHISEIKKMINKFNYSSKEYNPEGCFANIYVDNNDGTISDLRTGLMWQKIGSGNNAIRIKDIDTYIAKLNSEKYAGYSDWRLPTLEEVMSLMEKNQFSGYRIDYLFDRTFYVIIWTGDYENSTDGFLEKWMWTVDFFNSSVACYNSKFDHNKSVKCVREINKGK